MRRAERGAVSLVVMVSSIGMLGACVAGQLQPHRASQRHAVQQPAAPRHATETLEDALRSWHVARQSP